MKTAVPRHKNGSWLKDEKWGSTTSDLLPSSRGREGGRGVDLGGVGDDARGRASWPNPWSTKFAWARSRILRILIDLTGQAQLKHASGVERFCTMCDHTYQHLSLKELAVVDNLVCRQKYRTDGKGLHNPVKQQARDVLEFLRQVQEWETEQKADGCRSE